MCKAYTSLEASVIWYTRTEAPQRHNTLAEADIKGPFLLSNGSLIDCIKPLHGLHNCTITGAVSSKVAVVVTVHQRASGFSQMAQNMCHAVQVGHSQPCCATLLIAWNSRPLSHKSISCSISHVYNYQCLCFHG
jgi:hypothetical protein